MSDEPTIAMGRVLRRVRKERGWTIEEAALRARLHPVFYGELERGRENPTFRVLDRILAGLRMSWGEFGMMLERERT